MKKAILYKISYLVEVDEEEVSDHKGKEKFWKLAWGKLPEQEIVLDEPVEARFVRMDLLENFGTPIPWTETSEIKIYP